MTVKDLIEWLERLSPDAVVGGIDKADNYTDQVWLMKGQNAAGPPRVWLQPIRWKPGFSSRASKILRDAESRFGIQSPATDFVTEEQFCSRLADSLQAIYLGIEDDAWIAEQRGTAPAAEPGMEVLTVGIPTETRSRMTATGYTDQRLIEVGIGLVELLQAAIRTRCRVWVMGRNMVPISEVKLP